MNKNSYGHDLLLLMLSIAQFDNQEKILSVFVEAMGELFAPACFSFLKSDQPAPEKGFPLQTVKNMYGWVVVSGNASPNDEQQGLLWNAVQMLAIIVERNEQNRLLANDRERLNHAIDEQTSQLLRVNADLVEANVRLHEEANRHRQTAEALLESERIFEQFMEYSPFFVFFKNDEIRPVRLSKNFETILGKPIRELLGKTMDDLFPSDLAKSMVADDLRVLHEGKPLTIEEEFNGRIYTTIKFPIHIDGKARYLAGFTIDITDRKHAESLLADEKERLAVTLRSIGDGVITTDTHGNVIIMNKVAEHLTGWLQSEGHGKPLSTVFRIINEETRLPCENPAEKVLATSKIIELANHTVLISRDGTERIIADSGAPIMDKNSKTIGVVLVFRDMSEKQKLLDAIQRADKLDAIGVLAGGIAHDFNNLLTGVFGYMEIAREFTTEETIANYLGKAMAVFDRAKDLTQQLLAFSKGGMPIRKTAQLGPIIKESAAFALSGSKLACDFDIPENLWLANFDKNQLGQLVDNLVINAQQAMPAGGKISIAAKNVILKDAEIPLLKGGMFIKISVTDTGIGIPADMLKRIFDPFFTTKQKGSGLGLATCYAIIQKHDGCIEVDSVMGKGSTFHVFLPASQNETAAGVSQTFVLHRGCGKILILDDEDFIREILGSMLKEMGYSTCEARDGEEALRLLADAALNGPPINGAIFDLTIPGGKGGKEIIAQLRRQYPAIPVYASSGYSENPIMAKPTEFGFTDSICKPYRKDELAALLNRNNQT